ncbi:thioredoxin family protein [Desulfogranum mediterraneum]|uniref:thioredoxin family protein n=1 Tax=Desulfogranum mediterraneum TaxID=160661 RepID=UPI00041D8A9F|nr:thioredoxin family protein [Desulfogranum mediterraneum]
MVLTASNMLALGTRAPAFFLADTSDRMVALDDIPATKGLLVVFMCNHCPYVQHVLAELIALGREYVAKGIGMVGINANDDQAYPNDSHDQMKTLFRRKGLSFPYLHDASQEVARRYQAACTPDIFLFDGDKRLVYRGQLDDARPGNQVAVSGRDLRRALDALLKGEPIAGEQKPAMGCNIKWRPGNEPDYFSLA